MYANGGRMRARVESGRMIGQLEIEATATNLPRSLVDTYATPDAPHFSPQFVSICETCLKDRSLFRCWHERF